MKNYNFQPILKRVFDVIFSSLLIIIFIPIFIFISGIIFLKIGRPIFFWSNRIGVNNKIFSMPKFRTMSLLTPIVATDKLSKPNQYIEPLGKVLRRFSLDELPQLISILLGAMSFVGPRPALFNQYWLINERTRLGIHNLKPGLTGWAQVNGRDELSIPEKVAYDHEYLQRQSLLFDIKIIGLTALKVIKNDGVAH